MPVVQSITATISALTAATNGTPVTSYTLQTATNALFTQNLKSQTVSIGSVVTGLNAGTTYFFRVFANTASGQSIASDTETITIPPVPAAPIISAALTKNVRKVTISWTNDPLTDPLLISGHEIYARYSSNGGITWDTAFTLLGTTDATTTTYVTNDLNIAKTYQFYVITNSYMGSSAASDTSALTEFNSIFISAYGYRYDGTNFNTAIQFAARYTGNSADSITVGTTVYTGWKVIENVQRYNGTSFIPLTQ